MTKWNYLRLSCPIGPILPKPGKLCSLFRQIFTCTSTSIYMDTTCMYLEDGKAQCQIIQYRSGLLAGWNKKMYREA